MDEPVERLREQIDGLALELTDVKARLDRLEGLSTEGAEPGLVEGVSGPAESGLRRPPRGIIALIGRTLVILGGGYLFRALTSMLSDGGLVPAEVGALAGLAYGTWWLAQADRSAAQDRRLSAVFFGLAALMITYPLIWETTTRFQLLTPTVASLALVSILCIALAVSWRRDLRELVWIVALFTVATGIVLGVATRDFIAFSIPLLLLVAVLEVAAFGGRWLDVRWAAGLGLDLAVLMLVSNALATDAAAPGQSPISPGAVIAICMALPALHFASIAARTLIRSETITVFDGVQAALALGIGLGGAARVLVFNGWSPAPLGAVCVVLGAACYVAAFAFIERRAGRAPNFYAYSSFAGLLVLVGTWALLEDAGLAVVWSLLAITAIEAGRRFDRDTLRYHGTVCVVAATAAGGAMGLAFDGLIAKPGPSMGLLTPVSVVTGIVAASSYGLLLAASRREAPAVAVRPLDLAPRVLVSAIAVWVAAGMLAGALGSALLAISDADAGASFVAAGRTGVIAISAVALALAARRWSLQELGWLVYPLLLGGGLKLVIEDFRHDVPVALFFALALYGGALIITPRLMRREAEPVGPRGNGPG